MAEAAHTTAPALEGKDVAEPPMAMILAAAALPLPRRRRGLPAGPDGDSREATSEAVAEGIRHGRPLRPPWHDRVPADEDRPAHADEAEGTGRAVGEPEPLRGHGIPTGCQPAFIGTETFCEPSGRRSLRHPKSDRARQIVSLRLPTQTKRALDAFALWPSGTTGQFCTIDYLDAGRTSKSRPAVCGYALRLFVHAC